MSRAREVRQHQPRALTANLTTQEGASFSMPWMKVDDKLHDHRKSRKAGKAAMGVWVLAGSWCMDNDSDGFVPAGVLHRWGTPKDAKNLIDAGLWREATYRGEQGWRFHDWTRFQPSAAVTAARRAAEAEAGARGNHKRWHADRGLSDPDCEYCHRVPDQVPDDIPDEGGESPPISGSDRVWGESPPIPPVPEPDPLLPSNEGRKSRPDADRLCEHLADRIAANGSKRPAITQAWRDSARLLLDRDERTEAQAIWLIDWCQADDFWSSNILSMPKFREKFDQLALKARPAAAQAHQGRAAQWLTLARDMNDQGSIPQIGTGR